MSEQDRGVRSRRPSLGMCSLVALVAGLALGTWGHLSNGSVFLGFERLVAPLGALWIGALQTTLLPLVSSQLLAAIVRTGGAGAVGRLGLRTILLFIAMLAAAGLLTLAITPPLLSFYRVDEATARSLKGGADVPELARRAADAGARVDFPSNLVESARKGEILPILLFTALFGAAVTRIPEERRLPLVRACQGLAEAMLILVRWILLGTPVGVFALSYAAALHSGAVAAGVLGAFIVLVSGLLLFFTALLYPVTALFGRTSIRTFARAVAPAQLVAITTQSSIASLPALVQGGVDHLRLPAPYTAFVLPLTVSLFKLNRTISATAKLLFLAYVLDIPLSAGTIATFIATVILLSFGTVGLPGGATAFGTLAATVAAGLPIEAVVIMEATSMPVDAFKTLLNVTGDMSAATLLSLSSRMSSRMSSRLSAEPIAETVNEPAGVAEGVI